MHFRSNTNRCEPNMRLFTRTTFFTAGLLAAVTSLGVYGATAGNGIVPDHPAGLHAESDRPAEEAAVRVTNVKNTAVIRVVGPRFFPDNGDIKLHGAPVTE